MSEKITFTHVEIQRVQNGFVVMGVNHNIMERYMGIVEATPRRVSMVAKSAEELGRLIASLCDESEFCWQATVDLPAMLVHREKASVSADKTSMEQMKRAAAAGQDQISVGPRTLGMPLTTGKVYPST